MRRGENLKKIIRNGENGRIKKVGKVVNVKEKIIFDFNFAKKKRKKNSFPIQIFHFPLFYQSQPLHPSYHSTFFFPSQTIIEKHQTPYFR